jgi:hypothetical protein
MELSSDRFGANDILKVDPDFQTVCAFPGLARSIYLAGKECNGLWNPREGKPQLTRNIAHAIVRGKVDLPPF